ncbi:MAG: hypothetical protein E7070_11400 [Bacteroidales bacterium]|nr:hypothetical protein [Bacteroidales bacterium]
MAGCGGRRQCEEAKGDPSQTRIYTLENGLKVNLSVNKEESRSRLPMSIADAVRQTGIDRKLGISGDNIHRPLAIGLDIQNRP